MYGPLPAFGLYLRHARDLVLRDVELRAESADERPALVADDVTGLHLTGLSAGAGNGDGPAVWLNDVRGALVHGNLAPENVGVFLRVSGERTTSVALVGNAYRTPEPIELAPELAPQAVTQVTDVGAGRGATAVEPTRRTPSGA